VYTFLGQYDKARIDYDAAIRLGKGNAPANYARFRALVDVYAGEPEKGIAGLEQLVQAIDGMGIPEPEGLKAGVLSDEAVIASHIHKFDIAEGAISRLDSLERKQGERSGNADIKRGVEADGAFWEGRLAAFRGDYPLARRKVAEFMKLTEPVRNPTKNRPAHAVLGFIALFQKHYDEAIKEFLQGDPDNIYLKYQRALALEGAGRAAEAKTLFKEVANYNFNTSGTALVRGDALARAR
jgi:tetratricopeptide (TPR) repeat protein